MASCIKNLIIGFQGTVKMSGMFFETVYLVLVPVKFIRRSHLPMAHRTELHGINDQCTVVDAHLLSKYLRHKMGMWSEEEAKPPPQENQKMV